MNLLITGTAGFIGFHLTKRLLSGGHKVVGLDNINDYYNVTLKYGRLQELGINHQCSVTAEYPVKITRQGKGETQPISFGKLLQSSRYEGLRFIRMDLLDKDAIMELFASEKFDRVVHLAAQAGVRYSLENPWAYIDSNIIGHLSILEACRHHPVQHLVYASSSSVYGSNTKMPLSVEDFVDHPISLYAATKKADELMSHTYSHLFGIPTTGLRFFTVYGPWGRPDMALFLFTKAILDNKPIDVYNYGEMYRDFTYIDDIVEGVTRVLFKSPLELPQPPRNPETQKPSPPETQKPRNPETQFPSPPAPYNIYNIGNSNPVHLMEFIHALEEALGRKARMNLLPMQPGDVPKTFSDVTALERDMDYHPDTPVKIGIARFVKWLLSMNNE